MMRLQQQPELVDMQEMLYLLYNIFRFNMKWEKLKEVKFIILNIRNQT